MARVPASGTTRKRISELLSGEFDKSELVKAAMQLIVEEALEAEVSEALGRGYYERGASAGYRNGYRTARLKSAEGAIEYAAPQVSDTDSPWRSEVKAALSGRTEELERLAIEMYARGLSMRDIEAAFTDERGCCALSKSAASQVAERLWEDYQAFASRDLGEFSVLYLFIDGIAERLHLKATPRSGARRLGYLGQRSQGALRACSRRQGGYAVLPRILTRLKSARDERSDSRGFRRRARTCSGDRGSVSALASPKVPRAQDPQPRSEGSRRALARNQSAS